MGAAFSASHKCIIAIMAVGLTLLIAGGIFFLISVGLPQTLWLILGGVCLAGGGLSLALGLGFWLYTLTISPSGWTVVHREEAEAFTGSATCDDICDLTVDSYDVSE